MLSYSALMILAAPLLALPGPSNALVAAAGAERGLARGLPLLVVLPLAYGLAIGGWAILLGSLFRQAPALLALCQLAAALFLLLSGWRMLTGMRRGGAQPVASASRLMATTLANPKALILAIAMLPGASPGAVVLVASAALPIGFCWLAGGHALAVAAGERLSHHVVGRLVALVYGGFALYLAGAGLRIALVA